MAYGIRKNNKHSFDDFGLTIKSKKIGNPKKNKIKEEIPFMNGSYDFSLLYGDQTYSERKLEYTFNLNEKNKIEMNVKKIQVLEWLNDGGKQPLYDDTIPGFYFLAEVEDDDFSEDGKNGELTVTFNAYPYKIASRNEKTFAAIKDKLLDRLGGELRVRWQDGKRYLDYLIKIGEKSETEIRLSKNLKTIEQERDPTSIIPRLVPLGAKLEDSDERTTIKSVNNGKDYIDDPEAIAEFGLSQDCIVWDDVNVPSILLTKGKERQKEINRIKKKHKLEALDLSIIGLDFNSFKVGNEHPVINPIMNINEYIRITEKTTQIHNPQSSSLMVGDKFEDMKQYNLNNNKTAKVLETVRGQINTTVDVVGNVSTELNNTVEVVNNTVEVLASTNQTVAALNAAVIDINQALQENINKTLELARVTNEITDNLEVTNQRVDKLKIRVNMGV